jgi:hypothetical protein
VLETTIEDACGASLPPKQLPDPHGAPWWNNKCTAAHTTARSATNRAERKAATKALQNTLIHAKRQWAHAQLHEATEAKDIWCMAAIRKGRCTNFFPALRDTDGTLVTENDKKAELYKQCFFLPNPCKVDIDQPDDPPAVPT